MARFIKCKMKYIIKSVIIMNLVESHLSNMRLLIHFSPEGIEQMQNTLNILIFASKELVRIIHADLYKVKEMIIK